MGISILIGVLFFGTQLLLVSTSVETINFLGRYPELLAISIISSLSGYLIYAFISKGLKKNLIRIAIYSLIAICIWIVFIIDRPVLLESIFYQNSTRLLIALSFLIIGILLSDQKEVQKGGFLIGMLFFLFLGEFLQFTNESLKWILLFLLIGLFINYLLRTYLSLKNQFLPTRLSRRNYKYFIPLYQSFLILFVITIGTYFYRNLLSLDLVLIIFLTTYTITRSIAIYKIPEQVHRIGFIYGRYLLTISFILYAASYSWNNLFYGLIIAIAVGLGFFRPSQSNERFNQQPILLGILGLIVCGLIIYITKYNILFIHLLFLLYAIIYLPIQGKTIMNPIDKQAPLIVGMLLSMLLFQIPSKAIPQTIRIQQNYVNEPIPFYLSNLFEENKIYTFIQSNLPYSSPVEFPTEDEIISTIPILGFNQENKYLKYYWIYLTERNIPHYILVSESEEIRARASSVLSGMSSVNYPGFTIYYFPESIKPAWSSKLSKDWKFTSINDKLKSAKDWKEFPAILNQMSTYGGSEIRSEVAIYKSLLHDSILEYCKYFAKEQRHSESIDCIDLSLRFGDLDIGTKEIAFDAMNFITPSSKHIALLEYLSKDPKYRASSLAKLFPLYDSIDDFKNSVDVIQRLRISLQENNQEQELRDLEIEEARYFIKMNKWEEASSSISSNFRKYPQSIVWQRLNEELAKWKESRRNYWTPKEKIDTKNIK